MVRPKELVEALLYTLQQSDSLPDAANFVGYEPDIQSESIKLPLVEVSLSTQFEIDESNTDFIGYKYDSDGRELGRIYESLYSQELTVAVWTAHGSKYSPRELGDVVRDELYNHETQGPGNPLRHPEDGRVLDEVWRVSIIEGAHTDELGRSPTLRRWEETLEISASEQYVTDEDPIASANLNTQ
jgi:hypothetical protein